MERGILLGGVLTSAIALVGSVTLVLQESTLKKILLPLVSFAAGSLVGGALFHMIPASLISMPAMTTFGWVTLGFPALLRARAVPSLAPLPLRVR